jgi:hypothetical protein
MWQFLNTIFDVNFPSPDRHNLQALDQHLAAESVIAEGYHPNQLEAVFAPVLLATLRNINRGVGPIAAYQYHSPIPHIWSHISSTFLRMHLLPVVRPGNPKDKPYLAHQDHYLADLKHHTQTNLKYPGGLYGVVAGGGRHHRLPGPDEINLSFVKLNADLNLPYIPMAIYRQRGRYVQIRVGELVNLSSPINPDDRSQTLDQAIFLMQQLAKLLPPDRSGPYQP